MIRFESDYSEGAHQIILDKLQNTNMEQTPGYGEDSYCEAARGLIAAHLNGCQSDIHFLVGGTQTNLTLIAAALRPHQAVIAAASAHINTHETGAIEATGHKVISINTADGRLTDADIRQTYEDHWQDPTHEHIVQPALVYISQPTECGTIYSLQDLELLSNTCQELDLLLYVDGARLGFALAVQGEVPALADLARLTDAFYIGGTKVGALFGEALVINNQSLKRDFRYIIKQRGGLLAKGRLLGIQFQALFEHGLYFEISQYAVQQALRIKAACQAAGYDFLFDSYTNQQFPILPLDMIEKLQKHFAFHIWQKIDDSRSAVRFCTSWATPSEHVDTLIDHLQGGTYEQG
ncbi:MAG: low specificity L-threonine aldolase [Clostridiaceae bacterium]|nr:low specificity L-threonine aldolase [Clostridiaceae bacterium]